MSHFRSWEIMVPRNLNDSTAVTVLFMMVSGGRAGGGGSSWSPLSSPQFWVCWAPSCCDCTRQPAAQTPVCKQSRLRPWWGQWLRITHKLQELDRGDFRCAVICVEGEKQWGENTALRGASAAGESPGCEFTQPHYCYLYVRNVTVTDSMSLTEGGGHRELWEFVWEKVRHDGIEGRAEVHK